MAALKSAVQNQQTTNNTQRPEAEVWLNVGLLNHDVAEGEAPRLEAPFMGIPIDTAELKRFANNTKPEFEMHRNLFHAIQKMAESLAPGEAKIIKLDVEIRRRQEQAEAVSNDKSVDMLMASLEL